MNKMDENKLGPMRSDEVAARMRQVVINSRLRQLQSTIQSCLNSAGIPNSAKIEDEMYHIRHIVALDPKEDTGDIIQTYLEYYNVYDVIKESGEGEVHSIIFSLIRHISFPYAEYPYKVIPLNIRD